MRSDPQIRKTTNHANPRETVVPILIYIGTDPLTMLPGLDEPGLLDDYRYANS